jgi:glycosyltransferase involved in cell wall biosynthesis
MRTAVYNRYWETGGGAEKYGGAVAQILAADGPLDMLSHDPVDVDWLADRLRLDLSRADVRLIDDTFGAVTAASGDYDLFVNVSYMSSDRAATPASLYVVHFPTPLDAHLSRFQRQVVRRLVGKWEAPGVSMAWGEGFHARDGRHGQVAWTNGRGRLYFTTEPERPVTVELVFGHHRPAELGATTVAIEVAGEVATKVEITPPGSRVAARLGARAQVEVVSPEPGVPVTLDVVSDTFLPGEVLGNADRRRLGVPLIGVHVGTGRLGRVARHFPVLQAATGGIDWLGSYGLVVANSAFTRGWIDTYWGYDSKVLYPPVTMYPAGAKEPAILNVGRFFPADRGHSKKQLELVQAFRRLCDAGVHGWTLHLCGGCSDGGTDYLDLVRRAAAGYPVEFHVNASGAELESLYARASIYWHASGLGEDPQRHPDRLEHFGISTVEAMSAGAVPVVIGLAGQRETVRHGVDGYHFRSLDGLVALTRDLIDDPGQLRRMSASAAARARRFGLDAFGADLHILVERVLASGDGGSPDGQAPLDAGSSRTRSAAGRPVRR